MHDLNRALAEIVGIRGQLATSTTFKGVGPKTQAITGLLALALGKFQHINPPAGMENYLYDWILQAVIVNDASATMALARAGKPGTAR